MSRRAVVSLGAQQIARMLALPEGVRVLAARDDFMRDGVAVLVEGEQLDDQPPACVLPDLPVAFLDRTELAMQAPVLRLGDWFEVGCPRVSECAWSMSWEHEGVALGKIADAVQQHLTMDHRVGL